MDVGVYSYPHGDSLLIEKIVNEFLSQGKFDKLRKECMSDADTKPAYQNLQQRVESTVTQFLKKQVWRPDLNKNQLRDSLRKHILDSNFFDAGINRIVDQVVNPNVLATVFLPEVEEVVYNYLSIPKPVDKSFKRAPTIGYEKLKPPGSENDKYIQDNERNIKGTKSRDDFTGGQHPNDVQETNKPKESIDKIFAKEFNSDVTPESIKIENGADDKLKKIQDIKTEDKIKVEEDLKNEEFSSFEMQGSFGKMELPSDESQESVSRMGVERLQITETGRVQSMDSDDSIHLEINEKSMSESRDSEDSIMNQMSPISQGRLTPDIIEEEKVDKLEKEEKKPLTFIGRIPKIKREDSEPLKCSKKEETAKCDKLDVKNIYSSDESDSSKSYGKSDSDDKKSKDKKKDEKKFQKNEKSHRSDMEKRRKEDDNRKSFKEKDRDKKSREEKSKESNSKERKREKSKDRSHNIKKSSSSSCSSSSREKSSGHHRSSHQSRHKDPKSKEGSHDKKRKEDEKKKSKSTDDHGKERNKKDDRRSTDRDSKERDRSSGSRSQGESRKREREQKTEDYRGQKTQKDEAAAEGEVEFMPESEEIVIEMEGDWVPEGEEIVLVNEDWICSQDMIQETDVKSSFEDMKILIRKNLSDESVSEREAVLDFIELAQVGALTKIDFPKLTDDFYVKFNSTGFKYFEEWEKCKLDCEEEFKEFVDEAENDLALISDDGSDPESEFNFEEENRKTISNLLKGLSNFKKSLMFDPFTSQFYRWTNSRFYQKFRKKNEKNWWRNAEKNESDESIKENIDRVKVNCQDFDCQKDKNKENLAREKKALLHLKLLNRYKRRAIRQGKQRRRHRRKGLREGIKEKNENSHTLTTVQKNLINFQSEDGCLFRSDVRSKSETETSFLGTNMSGRMSNSAVRKDNVMNKFNFSLVEVVPEVSNASPVENGKSKPEPDTYETTVQEMVSNAYEFQSKNGVNNLHLDGEFTRVCDNRLQVVAPSLMTMLPDSPEDIKAVDTQRKKKGSRPNAESPKEKGLMQNMREESIKSNNFHQKCHLPLSPESDDCNPDSNGVTDKESKSKRILKLEPNEGVVPKKQRRNYCQKYESQDLYKPRPILNSSRTRSRADRGIDIENLGLNSSLTKPRK